MALFGTGLAYELKKFNIQVNTLTPSFVSTNMFHKHARAKNLLSLISFTVPSVELYVKSAILTLSSGDVKTCGYFIHEVLLVSIATFLSMVSCATFARLLLITIFIILIEKNIH